MEYSIKALIDLFDSDHAAFNSPNWYMHVRNAIINSLSKTLYKNAQKIAASISNGPFAGDFIYGGIPEHFFPNDLKDQVDILRHQGILYKTRHRKFFVPLLIFEEMLLGDLTMSAFHDLIKKTYDLSGKDFEAIDLHVLACRVRFLSLLNRGPYVSINDHLFPGAEIYGRNPGFCELPSIISRSVYDVLQENEHWIWKHQNMDKAQAKNNIVFDDAGQWQRVRMSINNLFGIDGRLILSRRDSQKKVMIVIRNLRQLTG